MKRDMDLLREILIEVEKFPFDGKWRSFKLAHRSQEEVCYHVLLAGEAGLLEFRQLKGTSEFMVSHLTYEGHEFLDAARSDTVWAKAKAHVISTTSTLTFEAVKVALTYAMKQAVGAV